MMCIFISRNSDVISGDTLQCVAVCCSVLQCVAVCCSVLQCVSVCCSVLQCVAEMFSVRRMSGTHMFARVCAYVHAHVYAIIHT